ncbi:MAG: translocation/assembly module TamB [Bacteroidales bacterium]|nr:translocation/assembly module TamB [Bacteroidales bacterium]
MKITGNRMSIGEFNFRPFNQLKLNRIYVEDLEGDTLLYADKLSAGFDLFKILDNQLLINTIDLDNFVANVNKDSLNGDFNFQFLIDAFSSGEQDTTSTSSMVIQINDIKINNGRINYDILSEEVLNDSVFDYNHIHIRDFEAHIDLNSIDIEDLDAKIENLSLRERSGLVLQNGQVNVTSQGKRIDLEDLQLRFPRSQLEIPEAWVDYTNYELATMTEGAQYFLQLGENTIYPADFRMFYPDIVYFEDELTFSGRAEGTLPQINIPALQATYGNHIGLNLNASLQDLNHWENTPLELNLDHLRIDTYGIEKLMNFGSTTSPQQLPVRIGSINLTGKVEGRLPDLLLEVSAQSDRGTLSLNGSGGYEVESGNADFNARLASNNFDIRTLMQDTTFGVASLQIHAIGNITGSGNMNVQANANIDRFDFNGYPYNQIQAEGTYAGDSIQFSLNCEDINLPVYAEGRANIGQRNPYANLYLRADSIKVDTLNFLPDYNDVIVAAAIKANVNGFDPENMDVDLSVDSLYLHTSQGVFYEPSLSLTYLAADSSRKAVDIDSRLITGNIRGQFTYAGLMESVKETFPMFFADSRPDPRKKDLFNETLNFRIGMNEINSLSDLLQLPQSIPDSILLMGRYNNDGSNMNLAASAYTMFTESDTIIASVILRNIENRLGANIHLDNKSSNYDFDGGVDAEVEFLPVTGSSIPEMNITFNPSVWVLNETFFDFNPSKVEIRENRYTVEDLSLSHMDSPNEYIRLNGVVSAAREDSLSVDISHFQFGTIFGAMKADMPLSGEANGRITARSILATPFVFTRNLSINNIIFAENEIGDINIQSGWNSERNGVALRATLDHPQRQQSVISGFILPERDSLSLNARIRDIRMDWIEPLANGALYGLKGNVGANIRVNGRLQQPNITGTAYFDQAQLGVSMLNTLYSFSDSIYIHPNRVEVRQFAIRDENNNRLTIDGRVSHHNFTELDPNISIAFNNFQVINNEQQTDSLFYGNLRANGRLRFTKVNEDFLLSGNISHADDARIMINIPSSASAAQRYNFVTYVDALGRPLTEPEEEIEVPSFILPFRVNISLALNSGLEAGVVYNRATGDAVEASGNGTIGFIYELGSSNMSLSGDFTLQRGKATLSLLGLTTKTFTVQPGSTLTFRGDPLNTSFDLTALYTVRADMTTLDQSFGDILARSRIPVVVSITATGSMNDLDLQYNIDVPNQSEEVQRRVDGLLYTDDIKIRQVAYLLATGNFMPPDSNTPGTGGNLLTSVGSSALSTALNSALAGILQDNWSIGTELRAGDDGFNDMDVDVNISTQLFDNRLTINGTLGYTNDQSLTNNFTGDFEAEYKLIPSGNIVLRAYNKTNNTKYFETAPYTQGLGVVYKRNAKTFGKLFDRLIWRRNTSSEEFEVEPVVPVDDDEATEPEPDEQEVENALTQ